MKDPRGDSGHSLLAALAAAAQSTALRYRFTQRKPMWLMPVSIIWGRRAAGR